MRKIRFCPFCGEEELMEMSRTPATKVSGVGGGQHIRCIGCLEEFRVTLNSYDNQYKLVGL